MHRHFRTSLARLRAPRSLLGQGRTVLLLQQSIVMIEAMMRRPPRFDRLNGGLGPCLISHRPWFSVSDLIVAWPQ
jgi:hypothetical protein